MIMIRLTKASNPPDVPVSDWNPEMGGVAMLPKIGGAARNII